MRSGILSQYAALPEGSEFCFSGQILNQELYLESPNSTVKYMHPKRTQFCCVFAVFLARTPMQDFGQGAHVEALKPRVQSWGIKFQF